MYICFFFFLNHYLPPNWSLIYKSAPGLASLNEILFEISLNRLNLSLNEFVFQLKYFNEL